MLRVRRRSKSEGLAGEEVSELPHPSPSPEAQEPPGPTLGNWHTEVPLFPLNNLFCGSSAVIRADAPTKLASAPPQPAWRRDRVSGREELCPPRQVGALPHLRSSRPREMSAA